MTDAELVGRLLALRSRIEQQAERMALMASAVNGLAKELYELRKRLPAKRGKKK